MKKVKSKFKIMAFSAIALTVLGLGSCSKSNSGSTPPPPPPPPVETSDSVEPGSLIAYWPFDGNVNDVKGQLTGTGVGVTYVAGVKGQAYQGGKGVYATVTPGAALKAIGSYSMSLWFKLAAQPAAGDPAGVFFMSGSNVNNNGTELIFEIEPNTPVSKDSIKVHHGFVNVASTGYQGFTMESYDTSGIGKWINEVITYDGPTSIYTIYQNGVAIGNKSAFSNGLYVTPTTMYFDGNMAALQGPISYAPDPPVNIYIGTWTPTVYGVSPTLGANGCFEGQMDELRIWNKALTLSDVSNLYKYGLAGK
jgi:hypothetical protein